MPLYGSDLARIRRLVSAGALVPSGYSATHAEMIADQASIAEGQLWVVDADETKGGRATGWVRTASGWTFADYRDSIVPGSTGPAGAQGDPGPAATKIALWRAATLVGADAAPDGTTLPYRLLWSAQDGVDLVERVAVTERQIEAFPLGDGDAAWSTAVEVRDGLPVLRFTRPIYTPGTSQVQAIVRLTPWQTVAADTRLQIEFAATSATDGGSPVQYLIVARQAGDGNVGNWRLFRVIMATNGGLTFGIGGVGSTSSFTNAGTSDESPLVGADLMVRAVVETDFAVHTPFGQAPFNEICGAFRIDATTAVERGLAVADLTIRDLGTVTPTSPLERTPGFGAAIPTGLTWTVVEALPVGAAIVAMHPAAPPAANVEMVRVATNTGYVALIHTSGGELVLHDGTSTSADVAASWPTTEAVTLTLYLDGTMATLAIDGVLTNASLSHAAVTLTAVTVTPGGTEIVRGLLTRDQRAVVAAEIVDVADAAEYATVAPVRGWAYAVEAV